MSEGNALASMPAGVPATIEIDRPSVRAGSRGQERESATAQKRRSLLSEGSGILDPPPATRATLHLAAVATYLLLALVFWAHVWIGGDPARAITCNCGDTVQQVWWFEWLPWAVIHGHDPFLTNALWARLGGVNVLSNTSWLAPAAVLAPITQLFGPVASYNVANVLAPVLSGWAAFVLAAHISSRTGARLVAGALFAFSPYVVTNTVLGHLDLTLTAYLPLVLLLGLRLLSQDARPVRTGLWLGLLTILQFFTGLEVVALTAITGVLCAVGTAIWRPEVVTAARKQILVAASVGASLAALGLSYPLWFYFAGPRHVGGPFWPDGPSRPWRIAVPGPSVFKPGLHAMGYLGPRGPNIAFLGLGVLLAIGFSWGLWHRRRSCVVLAVVGLFCWGLESFPRALWKGLPLLSSIELVRFALPVSLCAALLIAASIDGWWSLVARRWTRMRDAGRRSLARAGIVVLVGAALLPIVDTYSLPFHVVTATVPTWFLQGASRLSPGTAVLTMPFAYGIESRPMAWQAESRDDFDLVGGWAFVPGGNGVSDEMMSPLGGAVAALRALSDDPLGITPAQQETIRSAVTHWRPLVLVVIPGYAMAGTKAAIASTLGRSPTWSDGAWVWDLHRTSQLGPLAPLTPRPR